MATGRLGHGTIYSVQHRAGKRDDHAARKRELSGTSCQPPRRSPMRRNTRRKWLSVLVKCGKRTGKWELSSTRCPLRVLVLTRVVRKSSYKGTRRISRSSKMLAESCRRRKQSAGARRLQVRALSQRKQETTRSSTGPKAYFISSVELRSRKTCFHGRRSWPMRPERDPNMPKRPASSRLDLDFNI